jgi:hypothetical protein
MAKIKINRAPVMTLWAAVVAEKLGYGPDEALSLGKAVAGLNAQAKGQRLGIFHPSSDEERQESRERAPGEVFFVEILGRPVPAANTPDGLRAVNKDEPVEPAPVRRYLEKKFGPALDDVRRAMEDLAGSFSPQELADRAYPLYEKFRPQIPAGTRGWGAAGDLDLDTILSLKI